jgi:DNA-binding response OmpR family regulator
MHEHSPHGTVLLLEDEALIAVALQDDLEEAGYSVAGPFAACADALSWLEKNRPDLAVLDTVLKDGPCREVALRLTSLGVPFLVYSGLAEDMNALPELAVRSGSRSPPQPRRCSKRWPVWTAEQ